MKLTQEQQDIINAVKNNNRIKIFAYAGTGKTTTLKAIAEEFKNSKILYLAFNKSIADEASKKFPPNTEVRTVHSLAFKYYAKYAKTNRLGFPELRECRLTDLIEILNVEKDFKKRFGFPLKKGHIFKLSKIIKELFDEFCYSNFNKLQKGEIGKLLSRNAEISLLMAELGLPIADKDILNFAIIKVKELWDLMKTHQIPISHNFYLKFFELKIPELFNPRYDIVLLDEAQDTNDVTLSIFEKIPAKKIMVGDVHQKIYGFRKSINAMEKWDADKTLRLTISFRFPSEVAKRANNIIVDFKREKEDVKSFIGEIEDKTIKDTCYISRTNGKLIEVADDLLQKGESFKLIRKPKEVFHLPLSVLYFKQWEEGRRSRDDIMEKSLLKFWNFTQIKDYAEDINDKELLSAINIVEKIGDRLEEIYEEVRKMQKKKKVNVFLTTAHSAKGLEWDKVIILDDFPDLAEELGKNGFLSFDYLMEAYEEGNPVALFLMEEFNLYYVALTRAKKVIDDQSILGVIIPKGLEHFNDLIKEKMLSGV